MSRRPGQIIKRGEKKWLIRIYRGEDPETGRRRYENRIVEGTKRDAADELADLSAKLRRGELPLRSATRLGEWCEWWLDNIAAQRVRTGTLDHYRTTLARYVKPDPIWGLRLQQVQTDHIQGLLRRLQEGRDEEHKLSPRTLRYVHSILSAALDSARRQGKIASNPAPDVQLPKQKRREMRALSGDEVEALLGAVQGDRFEAYFVLALDTGARPGELLALRWDDVDLEAGTVSIRRTLPRQKKGEPLRFEEPKTERSRRTLAVVPATARALATHRRRAAEERLAQKRGPIRPDDLMFTSPSGGVADQRNLTNRHFKPALKRAELPETVRLYDLRHTTATALLMRCVPVNAVSARLGHASAKMTLDVYGHVLPEADQVVANAITEAFFSAER